MSVSTTGVRWTALALLNTMSMPPKVATVRSIALLTWASSRTSTTSGSALPPALAISSAAVKIVPGSLGCGSAVLAATTMLAPSRGAQRDREPDAARRAGDEERVISKRHDRSSQCGLRRVDAVGGLDHGALEA